MTTLKVTWSLVIAGSLITAACGDSKSSMNPVAPSAVVIGAQSEEAGDGVSGPTAKGGIPGPPDKGDKGKKPETPGKAPTNTSPGAPVVKKVEIEGLISAKGGDSITVNAMKVVVPATCPIRHGQTPFTFADLRIGDRVHVRANRTSSEGVAATHERRERAANEALRRRRAEELRERRVRLGNRRQYRNVPPDSRRQRDVAGVIADGDLHAGRHRGERH